MGISVLSWPISVIVINISAWKAYRKEISPISRRKISRTGQFSSRETSLQNQANIKYNIRLFFHRYKVEITQNFSIERS